MTTFRLLLLSTALCGSLSAVPIANASSLDKLAQAANWSAFGLRGAEKGAYVTARSDGGGLVFSLELDRQSPGNLVISLTGDGLQSPRGERLTVRATFDNGESFDLPAHAKDSFIVAPLDQSQIAPFIHDFTALSQMIVVVDGVPANRASDQTFSLTGTTPTVRALADYVTDNDIPLPKPFVSSHVTVNAPAATPSPTMLSRPSAAPAAAEGRSGGQSIPMPPLKAATAPPESEDDGGVKARQASDHFDRVGRFSGWEIFDLPGAEPGAYLQTRSEGSGSSEITIGFDGAGAKTLYLTLDGPAHQGTRSPSVSISFDKGHSYAFLAKTGTDDATVTIPSTQIKDWLHDFATSGVMTVSWADGGSGTKENGQAQFSLAGGRQAVAMLETYVNARDVLLPLSVGEAGQANTDPSTAAIAPVERPTVTQSNSLGVSANGCKDDWRACADNVDLVNHWKGFLQVQEDCKEAGNKQARYGEPEWPSFWSGGSFGHFDSGDDYVKGGVAIAVEPDAKFQNAHGAMAHVTAVCRYDLNAGKVISLDLTGQ